MFLASLLDTSHPLTSLMFRELPPVSIVNVSECLHAARQIVQSVELIRHTSMSNCAREHGHG